IGKLLPTLVGKSGTIEKCRCAEIEAIGYKNIRREPKRVVIAEWGVQQGVAFVGCRLLRMLKFKIATVLVANFVSGRVADRSIEFAHAPGVLHEVITEAGDTVGDAGLRLNASRR